MSSTRSDPELDLQGVVPRDIYWDVLHSEKASHTAATRMPGVSVEPQIIIEPDEPADMDPVASYEASQAGLRASRLALEIAIHGTMHR